MALFDPAKLRSLLEVDRRGSIAGAARTLHLTPSAVSQHLSALERAAGTELLHRSANGSRLTPAGRAVVRHAATIEEALNAIAHDLTEPRARFDLTVGFVPSVAAVLARAVADHAKQWPGCTLRTVETPPEDARRAVLHGDLDAAVAIDWPGLPQPRSPQLEERVVLVEPLLVAHDPTSATRGRGLRRFSGHTWVAAPPDTGCGTALRAACRRAGFEPDIRHETNDFAAAVALAHATASVTTVPAVLGPTLPRGMATAAVPGLERHVLLITRRTVGPAIAALGTSLAHHLSRTGESTTAR